MPKTCELTQVERRQILVKVQRISVSPICVFHKLLENKICIGTFVIIYSCIYKTGEKKRIWNIDLL